MIEWIADCQVTGGDRDVSMTLVGLFDNRGNPDNTIGCVDVTLCDLYLTARCLHTVLFKETIVIGGSWENDCNFLDEGEID